MLAEKRLKGAEGGKDKPQGQNKKNAKREKSEQAQKAPEA